MNVRDFDRDRRIVEMHLRDGMTFEDIGRLEGITRERVRQIVRRNGVTVERSREVVRGARAVTLRCETCGSEFPRRDTLVARARRVFCSDTCRHNRVSDEGVLDRIRDVAERVGRTPTAAELDAARVWTSSVQKRFGSLRAAMLMAGLEPRGPGRWVNDGPEQRGRVLNRRSA